MIARTDAQGKEQPRSLTAVVQEGRVIYLQGS
jgi:hypothetical protein